MVFLSDKIFIIYSLHTYTYINYTDEFSHILNIVLNLLIILITKIIKNLLKANLSKYFNKTVNL